MLNDNNTRERVLMSTTPEACHITVHTVAYQHVISSLNSLRGTPPHCRSHINPFTVWRHTANRTQKIWHRSIHFHHSCLAAVWHRI